MKRVSAIPVAVLFALVAAATAFAVVVTPDVRVSSGSPPTPFSQNKQNEPTITVDAHTPNVLVAGSNDEIDMEDCNAGDAKICPFTGGVGVSGVYFSFDSGKTWTQPTYTGWTARHCYDPNPAHAGYTCTPRVGPIGTLPWYYENGLVADGDPAVAFGPKLVGGSFSFANGSRLYYANLTSNFSSVPANETFNGFEAIAISRTDTVRAAAAGGDAGKNAWMQPVIISRQSGTTFSDKEQIWADNAASSSFFGNVYVCWAKFQSSLNSHAAPAQLQVAVSSDGGDTWTEHPIGAAANNGQRNPLDGCTIRTDSKGTAYVFGIGTVPSLGKSSFELMSTSADGGSTWSSPTAVAGPVTQPGLFDAKLGRPTIDGVAGARSDLAPAPSVDIANGAPSGTDATNRIVMSYVSGAIDSPQVFFTESADGGANWSTPRSIGTTGDRGYYTAPAISPNGTDVYVVYNAFTSPYRTNTTDQRNLIGVVLHADVAGGATGAFTSIHRTTGGDPRGSSQNNLVGEFLGDYVYATATRTYGAAVWNDARNEADCPAIDAWRWSIRNAGSVPRPAPEQACPSNFGNSDIFGGAYTDPTP
jgi:hypothetical protein